MNKHGAGPVCYLCKDKLAVTDLKLVDWFTWLKTIFPDVHIAHSFRNEFEQFRLYNEGKSKLKFPNSKHNYIDPNGRPCSRALDIFMLIGGEALFSKPFYQFVWEITQKHSFPMEWGGNFKSLSDYNHFELS